MGQSRLRQDRGQPGRGFDGKVDIYKVNVDDEQELARAFGIRSIPTLLFIPLVGEPKKAMGAMPQNALREVLNDMIKQ